MYLRLSECRHIPANEWKCLQHARNYINRAAAHKHARSDPGAFLCGAAGINAIAAAVASRDDLNKLRGELDKFELGFEASMKNDWDEVLVGRAGFMSACYWLNEIVTPSPFENDERLTDIVKQLLKRGKLFSKEVKSPIPLMYVYHGTQYLGAAHGLCGIQQMLLQWCFDKDNAEKLSAEELDLIRNSIDAFVGKYGDS